MLDVVGTTNTRLNLRAGPGKEFDVIRVLEKGAALDVLEDMGDWLSVRFGDAVGYVHEAYVRLDEVAAVSTHKEDPGTTGSRAAETLERVNLREGPGRDYPVITTLPPGTVIPVYEDHGDWLSVMHGGQMAYLNERYAVFTDDSADAANEDDPESEHNESYNVEAVASVQLTVDMLAGPGEDYLKVCSLKPGDELVVLEDLGEWLNVLYEDQTGFVLENSVILRWKIFGRTTAPVNQRAGPGKDYAVLNVIPSNAEVEILEDLEGWVDVRYDGEPGFVEEAFIDFADLGDQEMQTTGRFTESRNDFGADHWLIELVDHAGKHYGDVVSNVAANFGLEPAVVQAVVAVECGQRGFNPDGSMKLRFENHVFWHYWGKDNASTYQQHFSFSEGENWKEHRVRLDPEVGVWQEVHSGSQEQEWAAYRKAAELDQTAARLSAGMGAANIMGFNFASLGYRDVHEMFEAFLSEAEKQIVGLFALLQDDALSPDGIGMLREKDFDAFASYYHGNELAAKYAGLLRRCYQYLTDRS